MHLRALRPDDLPAVLALNQSEEPKVGPLTADKLEMLFASAELALVVEDDERLLGFLLALGPDADYSSPNYRFFTRRGGRFLYIDRLAVVANARRRGIATRLYDAVDNHARSNGFAEITCEVNLRPVNAESLAFHLVRGFVEVGRQDTSQGDFRVLLLARRMTTTDDADRAADSLRLDVATVNADPLAQLSQWLDEASRTGQPDAAAMTLATFDGQRPDARVVLCRGIDTTGLRFFTDRTSPKARHLAECPDAAAVLWWPFLHRQVRVRGTVRALADNESDAYFASRPRGSQLSAWASEQSRPIADRAALEESVERVTRRFAEHDTVPRPPDWGGFHLEADTLEFWQGDRARLHDRVAYVAETRPAEAWQLGSDVARMQSVRRVDGWTITRYQP